MCDFDYVIGKHHLDEPFKAFKVFDRLTKLWAYLPIVLGRIPRGKWLRWDSLEVQKIGSGCAKFENGFHCFVKPFKAYGETAIPVKVKGDITVANQFGEEILVGEWIYVPTIEDLEREEKQEQLQAA